jgi:hypothetical protein
MQVSVTKQPGPTVVPVVVPVHGPGPGQPTRTGWNTYRAAFLGCWGPSSGERLASWSRSAATEMMRARRCGQGLERLPVEHHHPATVLTCGSAATCPQEPDNDPLLAASKRAGRADV